MHLGADGDIRSVKVGYADLDLSTTSGQHRLHSRLMGAAREACEDDSLPGSMTQSRTACMSRAMDKADVEFAALTTGSQPQVAMASAKGGSR